MLSSRGSVETHGPAYATSDTITMREKKHVNREKVGMDKACEFGRVPRTST